MPLKKKTQKADSMQVGALQNEKDILRNFFHGYATLQSHSRKMKTKNQKEISHMKLNMAAALKKNNQSLAAALGKNKRLNTTHSADV